MANPLKYTTHYQEECFAAWFSAGRPDRNIVDVIPEDEYGRKPGHHLIAQWRDENGWDFRADEIDAKAEQKSDNALVAMRVKMLKESQAVGREMRLKGMAHIREKGFDTSASAVNAIVRGAELERNSSGMAEWILKMQQMNDEELTGEALKLIERLPEQDKNNILDGEEIESTGDVEEEKDATVE